MSYSKDELRQVLRGVLREELKQTEKTQEPQGHQTIEAMVNCKDCYPNAVKAIDKFNYECKDCGLPLPDSMVGKENSFLVDSNPTPCPRCGGHEAEEREREE